MFSDEEVRALSRECKVRGLKNAARKLLFATIPSMLLLGTSVTRTHALINGQSASIVERIASKPLPHQERHLKLILWRPSRELDY
jgi:hypothetical protein